MAITIEQPGEAKAIAAAEGIIGKAQRAKEDRARAEREQIRKAQDKARVKAQETAMAWELQKMQMRSQKEFEKELRQYDYRLMQDDRAEMWVVEKMEMASRMDFERKETERQRKLSVIDNERAAVDKLLKSGEHDENELAIRNKLSDLDAREQAIKLGQPYQPGQITAQQQAANREIRAQEAASRAQEAHERRMTGKPEDPMAELLRSLISDSGGATSAGTSPPTNPMPTRYQEAISDKTGEKIISKDFGVTWEPEEAPRVIPPANFEAFNKGPGALIRRAPFFNR